MERRPPRYTRNETSVPSTTLFRSWLQRIRRTGTPDIPRSSGEGSSMKQVRSIPRRGLLSSALLLALAPAVSAQVAAPDPQDQQEQQSGQTATAGEVGPETLATIVVTGIRGTPIPSIDRTHGGQGRRWSVGVD